MSASSVAPHEHGRVASLSRERAPDDPELVEARQNLAAASLTAHVRKFAPKLRAEQLDTIISLLRTQRGGAHV